MTKTLSYVEIDIDYCALSYGSSPCTAAIGVTGERKCFNTFKTCQDKANFDNEPRTLRFAEATEYLPGDIECFPSIKSINYTPQKIDPGKSMGERASITITFTDHPDNDTFLDKYVDERPYDPWLQGTFFGKFRARNPYIKGRPLRFIMGLLGQSLDQMETRYFMIESTDGPGTDGTFKIVAKDILKIADGDRAQAPRKSNGELFAAIDEDDTSITLSPSGIGDLEYPASGHLAIGEEIVAFTRAGDVCTITRGQLGTTAESHDDGDLAQLVLTYTSEKPSDIMYDLFVTYAEANPAQIPLAEWTNEIDQYINRVYGAHIAKPTAVKDLINELIEQCGLVFWWDDESNQIKLRSLRPVTSGDEIVTDNSLLLGALKINDQPSKRVSQVWTSFAQLNPLEDLERQANYASGVVTLDAQSEIDHGMPAIHKVFSRWMGPANRSGAQRLNAQILSRYRDPPRRFMFSVDRFQNTLKLGRGFQLRSWALQDDTGAPETVKCIVTSLLPNFDTYVVEAEEMLFFQRDDLEDRRLIVIDQSMLDVNLRDLHDSIYTAPDEGQEVLFVIEAGAIAGGSAAPFRSIDVGDWPADCDLTLQIRGSVRGAGGRGGGYLVGDGSGEDGGTALYARYPITVDNTGTIAGGGGGGGAGWRPNTFNTPNGIGGGGGAGWMPGPHGNNSQPAGFKSRYGAWDFGTAATVTAGGRGGRSPQIDASGTDYAMFPGDGGAPAQAGTTGYWKNVGSSVLRDERPGGAAGVAVDGDSYITWTNEGTIIGARIN